MKYKFILFIFPLLVLSGVIHNVFSQTDKFEALINKFYSKDYFSFCRLANNDTVLYSDWQILFLNALKLNLQNKPVESNNKLEELLAKDYLPIHDSLYLKLYEVKIQNAVNLYRYQEASLLCEKVVNSYIKYLSDEDISNYQNAFAIFDAAKSLPSQSVNIDKLTRIPVSRDMAGMTNLEIKLNGKSEQFIIDTGANFSAIIKSLAIKLGLKPIGGKILVGTATDKKIEAELTYAESIVIGGIECKNVLFLVLPDESLSFGDIYKINGIIGLPVIRELKELRISENEIIVPLTTTNKLHNNFLMNGFIPVIEVINGKDSLIFVFDTGARKTSLFYPYYRKYKKEVDENFTLQELDIEGAGGKLKINGFIIDEVTLKIANSKIPLQDVKLFSRDIQERDRDIYGSIGQDFISKFSTKVINFESMYVEFVK